MHKLSYNDIIVDIDLYRIYVSEEFSNRDIVLAYNTRNFPLKMKEEIFYEKDIIKPFTEIDL